VVRDRDRHGSRALRSGRESTPHVVELLFHPRRGPAARGARRRRLPRAAERARELRRQRPPLLRPRDLRAARRAEPVDLEASSGREHPRPDLPVLHGREPAPARRRLPPRIPRDLPERQRGRARVGRRRRRAGNDREGFRERPGCVGRRAGRLGARAHDASRRARLRARALARFPRTPRRSARLRPSWRRTSRRGAAA
jgi:hypothetical protein